ncbi:hypothetical protein KR51_00009000 [Rubidibacter lacunae KORDI 51-2]|uniref:Uncharacterized protein n=1 Tax=Rubidibacter lacunae KORDI 51-2 TaxID=582515 RepID=U5DP39_9CHRO|nr:hypothetical protein [Rubidibacter lacunae]ERN42379.1 hypothetical protein KR51_00009000 [Rubidibacter lacunae KORDI 51-2]
MSEEFNYKKLVSVIENPYLGDPAYPEMTLRFSRLEGILLTFVVEVVHDYPDEDYNWQEHALNIEERTSVEPKSPTSARNYQARYLVEALATEHGVSEQLVGEMLQQTVKRYLNLAEPEQVSDTNEV